MMMMRKAALVTYQKDVENNATKRRDSGQFDGVVHFLDFRYT